jgi:hypothetical protein
MSSQLFPKLSGDVITSCDNDRGALELSAALPPLSLPAVIGKSRAPAPTPSENREACQLLQQCDSQSDSNVAVKLIGPVLAVPAENGVLTISVEGISGTMMYDHTLAGRGHSLALPAVRLKPGTVGTTSTRLTRSTSALPQATKSASAISGIGGKVAASNRAQQEHRLLPIDYLRGERLRRCTVLVENGGVELDLAGDAAQVENGGESTRPGEGISNDLVCPSIEKLLSVPPEIGTARLYDRVLRDSTSVGNGGEGICLSDPARAWRALACTATAIAPSGGAVRSKLGSDRAAEPKHSEREVLPTPAMPKALAARERERGARSNYGAGGEPGGASEYGAAALGYIGQTPGETVQLLVPLDLEIAKGKPKEHPRDWEVDHFLRAREEHYRGRCPGMPDPAVGGLTAMGESYVLGCMYELRERARHWKAWGPMLDGSGGGATSADGDTSHSAPKGCAEDTGVLCSVMC